MTSAVPVAIRRGMPLSSMQRPLWASQRRNPSAPVQNMATLSHLGAPIDVHRLVDAFAQVVRASDVLSSRIVEGSGVATMVPSADEPVTEVVDLDAATAVDWAADRVRMPVDATVRPYDSVVLRHADGTASWYLCIHHVATDATSTALVFEATADAYHGRSPDIDTYGSWLAGIDPYDPRRRRAAQYWSDRSPATTGGRLYQEARRPGTASSRVPVTLERDAVSAALAGDFRLISEELSWTALLAAATSVLLHGVARLEEFSLGVPVHNRSGAERVVGTLMEVFPVDVTVRADDTLRSLHKRVAKSLMTTLRHAAPGLAPTPDHEAVVNVIASRGLGPFGAIPVTHHLVDSGAVDPGHLLRAQLTANVDEPVRLFLDLNHAGADPAARVRAGEHLATILRTMADGPDTALADLDFRTPTEIALQTSWESTPDFADATPDIVATLAATLAERDDVAIEDATQSLTGRELWRRAHHVAGTLAAAGAGPGRRVGIEMGRSVDTVVAILATLVSGSSYVPLDPAQPRARLDSLAARAGCIQILRSLPAVADGNPVPVDSTATDEDEAYLLFTSGSSGEPKGVPITRLGLSRYIRFAAESYTDPQRPPVAALFSALTFDLTVTSIFTPLVSGGRVVVIADDGPQGLLSIAQRPDITWLKATPSHLEILVRLVDADHGIRTLVVGGEAFGAHLARRLHTALPGIRIFNEYGPTEAVVGCMVHETDPDGLDRRPEVPIGRPAPGVTLVVVDDTMRRVPTGAQGELCIAHVGLTAGYLDGPDAHDGGPFVEIDGRRFYRSGDLVRMADDETLVYLGRIDDQVKVGGIRLEPLEVADALERHPAVRRAVVGLWAPEAAPPRQQCVRCGLADNVPGTVFDDAGVCHVCHAYDAVAPIAASWFKTRDELAELAATARRRRTGDHDCLVLLSGGKDSTYALYQLVELGFHPYALTLDNGFISEEAIANVQRSVADLGIDHEFATHDAMNDIFRDSLDRHSNVCHGCYKTIYTLGTTRAVELGIPMVITGLSRGQLFETRLIPQQFDADRFDPEAIDRAVLAARKTYHRVDDGTNRLLDTTVFDDDDVFDRVAFVDFYRYVDVELAEMLDFLEHRAPWVRPADTGRSTNCLINAAGIHTHLTEQGYHNYAEPYAWDVRLGHKTRDEAIAELDDRSDLDDVMAMLGEVGYEPRPRQTLVAWIEHADHEDVADAAALRSFLTEWLPAHAIPAAFVAVETIPVTTNGKVDTAALPAPERVHRGGAAIHVAATTEAERDVVAVWEQILGIEPIGVDDDFFTIGGDSLTALRMIVALGEHRGCVIAEDAAFVHRTPRELAAAVEAHATAADRSPRSAPTPRPAGTPPALSIAEQAMLFEHRSSPTDPRYNVARLYRVEGAVDPHRFHDALAVVAERHAPLHWTYGSPRRRLHATDAVSFEVGTGPLSPAEAYTEASRRQLEPFDLDDGPLVRCWLQPLDDASTAIFVAVHHISADAGTVDRLWQDLDAAYSGRELAPILVDYADVKAWQEAGAGEADRRHWLGSVGPEPAQLAIRRPERPEPDGYVERVASVSSSSLSDAAGTTRFATTFGALAAALRRYVDGDHVAIGIVASTQGHPSDAPLVGYFLNTLPMAIDCGHDDSLRTVCARAGAAIAAGLPHRNRPLAQMLTDRREAAMPAPPLSVMVAFEDFAPAELDGLPASHVVLASRSAVTDATFFVQVRDDEVRLGLEYRGSVLGEALARQILDDFDRALSMAATDPATTIGGLTPPSVSAGLLAGPPLPVTPPVVERILGHVGERATEPAIVCAGTSMNWAELGERSAVIAAALIDAGAGRGDRVAIVLPRSTDLVAAMVACQRIAASCVPVDPTYPADRIEATIEAAGAAVALVDATTAAVVPVGPTVVDVATVAEPGVAGAAAVASLLGPDPDDEAYVIFTSGSTGRPRGVPVTHRTLAASTAARRPAYERQPGRFLVVSSPAFDSSVAGLFWSMVAGGTVVLPTDAEVHDPDALLALIASAGVTHTLMVPTLYSALLERGASASHWPDQVIVAGEPCQAALVRRHHELRPASALANEYGPTECTVWSTVHHCTSPDGPVPIGPPIAGTWLAVVDEHDRPRPAGVAGQLVIGGAGVVDGYLDDPEATAARFGVDAAGRRFFRTGDRAVVVDGTVLFLGRVDHQLNVGGVRAEPEEIEAVLLADPGVGAAVVVAADPRGLDQLLAAAAPETLGAAMARAAASIDPAGALADELRGLEPAERVLVAHLEGVPGAAPAEDALRRRAGRELPPGLRPRRYVVHDSLPRTPAGKVDRDAVRRLPVPTSALVPATVATASGPEPDIVARMARLFGDVLGVAVGADDSFFDLGGHSLLALRLVDRITETFGVPVGVAAAYDAPTPRAMAGLVGDRARVSAAAGGYLLTIRAEGDRPPIFGVHVLGVDAAFYRPLAARLGRDQPVHCLGLATTLEDATAPTAVEEIASLYAEELERVAPDGPVVLTAVSLGAVVAFELASTLRARGRNVLLVALFDASGPDLVHQAPSLRVAGHVRKLRTAPLSYLNDRRADIAFRTVRRLERVELAGRRVVGAELPDRLRVRGFIEANASAALQHDLAPYDGDVTVFRASIDPYGVADRDPKLGWGSVAVGRFGVVTVPGAHLSMLAEPHVGGLASTLRDRIDRALDEGPRAVSRAVVDARLRHAIHRGRFAATVEGLARRHDLAADATALVAEAERTLRATAAHTRRAAEAIAEALGAAGIDAEIGAVPALAERAWVTVAVADRPDRVVAALEPVGYRMQRPLGPGAWKARMRTSSELTLIALDESTTRVSVEWPGPDRAGFLTPRPTDLATVDLPVWAWRAYWAVRPWRLIGDRLRGRRAGGELGPYLGTTTGQVVPLLALADVGPDDVVLDIGCGDGRVLIEAVRHFGCRARGVERDADLAETARRAVADAGLAERIEIVEGDADAVAVDDVTVAFAFLPPDAVASLLPRVLADMAPGGRFVTHEQLAGRWPITPTRTELVVTGAITVASVWEK